MGEAKKWFTITCPAHGVVVKGQNFKEVVVPGPRAGSKQLGRHRQECPHCKAIRMKEAKDNE